MSSHHFVKEGQEPALYIHDAISFELVGPLLEWAPLVITRSSQAEMIISWGIKIDVVVDEAENPGLLELLESQHPVQVITVAGSTNYLHVLNTVLPEDGKFNITIVTEKARVFVDSVTGALRPDTITIVDSFSRWVGIGNGTFSKWIPSGVRLELYPEDQKESFAVEGARPADGAWVTILDGIITIAHPGFFWVREIQ